MLCWMWALISRGDFRARQRSAGETNGWPLSNRPAIAADGCRVLFQADRRCIGRAIVRQPRVFLMDEPLSNLDAKLRELLRAELKDLQMKLGATFLYVTHDQVEAMSMGDKIGVLNHGRIVQVGTPHRIYNHPRDTFVANPAMIQLLASTVAHSRFRLLSQRPVAEVPPQNP